MLAINEGDKALEEERRVMYVAVTRAKERLFISCAKGVSLIGNRIIALPLAKPWAKKAGQSSCQIAKIRENISEYRLRQRFLTPSKQSVLPSKP